MTTLPLSPTSLLVFAAVPDGSDPGSGSKPPPVPGRGLGAPYMMLASVLLGVGIGYALDRHFLTSPRWTAGLGMLGIVVGIYHAVREASR